MTHALLADTFGTADGNSSAIIGVALIVAFAGGLIASAIASKKGLSAGGYFLFGFFLPIIGIIVAAISQPAQGPPQPPNWYPDPWGLARLRYYDGRQWTYHVDPPAVPAPPPGGFQ